MLYHNHTQYTVSCSGIPDDDESAIILLKTLVHTHLHQSWKPEDRYVLMSESGDHLIYDYGFVYRMADSG